MQIIYFILKKEKLAQNCLGFELNLFALKSRLLQLKCYQTPSEKLKTEFLGGNLSSSDGVGWSGGVEWVEVGGWWV